jgi:nitroimidazol reductase NimA-like FMN-containing flavoprotein (pyridoxamine 5'-phosphate oxidase superfamily)
MDSYSVTDLNKVKRAPHRAAYDHATVYEILDAGFVCQVGFVGHEQTPFIIPMSYGRRDNVLYLHGASSSRIVQMLTGGAKLCIQVTHIDGIVIARSMFDTSVNYRSVVFFSEAEVVNDEEKLTALYHISEHITPGRWQEVREPRSNELKATTVLKVIIDNASAKIRTGPPNDDARDVALPGWAGVVPLKMVADAPVNDPVLREGKEVPPSVRAVVLKYSQ